MSNRTLADHPNTRGTAATADVTTSHTDTTAGRLLKVGDFGAGNPILLGSTDDMNNVMDAGFYQHSIAGAPSNAPIASAGALLVLLPGPSNWPLHFWMNRTSSRIFTRGYHASTQEWSAWREVYNQASILGTVSQSGGTPTGAIIERSNGGSNGDYVRFADGTQICTNVMQSTSDSTTNWTFPAAFSTTTIQVFGTASSGAQISFMLVALTNSSTGFNMMDTNNSRVQITARIMAIGRWF